MSGMHDWEDSRTGAYCGACGTFFVSALIYHNYNGLAAAREECPYQKPETKPKLITAAELQRVQKGGDFDH